MNPNQNPPPGPKTPLMQHPNQPQAPRQRPDPRSEILKPMTADPIQGQNMYRPRPQQTEEISSSGSGWSFKSIFVMVVVTAMVKLAFFSGPKIKHVSPEEAELSKSQPWPEDFKKGFIESCNQEAVKSMRAQPTFSGLPQAHLEKISANYCACVQGKVEGSHTIKTKFEAKFDTVAKIQADVEKSALDYMNSDAGKEAIQNCIAQAKDAT